MDFWQFLGMKLFGLNPFYGEPAVGVKDLERATGWYCELFDVIERRDGSVWSLERNCVDQVPRISSSNMLKGFLGV